MRVAGKTVQIRDACAALSTVVACWPILVMEPGAGFSITLSLTRASWSLFAHLSYLPEDMDRLSVNLRPLYYLELALGNEVLRVDEPAGTDCPLAVVFRDPLHFREAELVLDLSPAVESWACSDPHYGREAGFVCRETHHGLVGPAGSGSGGA